MKSTYLKKLIKEAVKEAIQEELKDILLEAVKTPKTQIIEGTISSNQPSPTSTFNQPKGDVREKYKDIIGETALSMTSRDVPKFAPQGSDPVSGNLGGGELSMNQITTLLNSK